MELSTAQVAATPSGNSWSQVQTFVLSEEDSRVVVAVSLRQQIEGSELASLGRRIFEYFIKSYSEKHSGLFERLNQAVGSVLEEFSELEVEIAVAVFWPASSAGGPASPAPPRGEPAGGKEFVYFCIFGEGKIFLMRDGKLTCLVKGGGEKQVCISGQVKKEDVFVLGTAAFFDTVDASLLKKLLVVFTTPQEAVEGIVHLINKAGNPRACGAIIKSQEGQNSEELQQPLSFSKTPETRKTPFFKRALLLLATKLPKKGIEIKQGQQRGRRMAISIGLVLILILLSSIGFGLRQKSEREYRQTYWERFKKAESLYNDSILQKDVNKAQAKEFFLEAQKLVDEILSEGVKDKKVDELVGMLGSKSGEILGIVKTKPELFLDLAIIRSEAQAEEIALEKDTLVQLDRQGGRVITVSVEGRRTQVEGGLEGAGNVLSLALYDDSHFVLTSEGVYKTGEGAVAKRVVEKADQWQGAVKLAAFGGNLYILEEGGRILRLPGQGGDIFSSAQSWLGSSVSLPNQPIDFAVDGSIWVLGKGGKINKYSRGSPEAFRIFGLDGSLTGSVAIYTDEQLESIFVLDKEGGRVVEINKKGEVQKQYLSIEASQAVDLAVSKTVGKLFLLTGTKILATDLK